MRGKERTAAQCYPISVSNTWPAYTLLDEIRKKMPPDLFVELIGVYVSETDERRQAVYDSIMKHAEMDGVTLIATTDKTDVK